PPEISILDETGTVGEAGGPFAGLGRFDARRRVKEAIERLGLARGAKDHSYAPGRCQRCRNIVEPMISTQWFCRMRPLAEPALAAVKDGRIRFVPANWEKTYFHWLESIQDWCISRQLWWGHRIPAWHCDACGEVIVSREAPAACGCGTESPRQDPDVLDTWFSSQLWPFAILGWPERTADLDRYYPTDVLVTGFDIIFFWVARMIMAGLELVGDVPFRTVLFHGLVRDSDGAKMSKTAGNVVDPATLVHRHGADAVRFTLAALASPGSDLSLAEERLAGYRAFMNKLWNATRFLLLKGSAGKGGGRADYVAGDLDDVDRFLVASYTDATRKIEHAYASFRFDLAAEELYHFLWHTYCDWSIELAKPDLANEGDSRRAAVRSAVLMDVLDGALRLLHPIAPFISEELWQNLPRREGDTAFLATARMPTADDLAVPIPHDLDTETARATIDEWLVGPVTAIRSLRASARVAAGREIEVRLCPRTTAGRPHLNRLAARIGLLARARVEVVDEVPGDEPALRQVLDGVEVVIPLSGAVDVEQERTRLGKEKAKLQQEVESQRRKLDNPSFVGKAPAEVVEKVRQKVASVSDRLQEIDRLLRQLG
ncbi:MAG: class I tRNA ligase family protein, partial [Acidobacteriota bacterium]|nr:class I tRNA ligase family protein [Acidobacteriota bacterium]